MAFANDSYYEELQKNIFRICEGTEQIPYFMHWKEGEIWNLEPGWMADTRYCVSSEKEVKAVCIWHFMKNCFDFMQ